MGYRRNLAADSAAKDALDGDILDVLILFSDVKPYVNEYLLEFRVSPQQTDKGFPMVKWLHFLPSEKQTRRDCYFSIGHPFVAPI